jgi:spoIIIJ-associated protein
VKPLIKEAFGKGATTEAAIEAAKAELNAPLDADVNVEIVETAKKKTLGIFGGSLAKARAYYEVPDEIKSKPVSEIKTEKPKKVQAGPVAKQPEKKAEAPVQKVEETVKVPTGVESETSKKAENYICSVLEGMGVSDIEIQSSEDDEGITVQLNCGNDYGYIIGRRGETLDAIQYLTRLVINKGNDSYKRVSINAGNYREKREETLRELAKKNAVRVKKYGRNVCLDPMNPYERRIIHTTIQEIEGVDSHSVGSESDRRVVITLAEGFKATNPGNNNNRNFRHNDRRRDNQRQQTVEDTQRTPRSDSAGINLYGKIEPKSKEE